MAVMTKSQVKERAIAILAEPETFDDFIAAIYTGLTMYEWCVKAKVDYQITYEYVHTDNSRLERYKLAIVAREAYLSDRVLAGLRQAADLDPRKAFDKNNKLLPVTKMPDGIAHALTSFEVQEDFKKGEVTSKIKYTPRHQSYEMLGKHIGLFKDKVEMTVHNPNVNKFTDIVEQFSTEELIALKNIRSKMLGEQTNG